MEEGGKGGKPAGSGGRSSAEVLAASSSPISQESTASSSGGTSKDAGGAHQAEDGRTDGGAVQGKTDGGAVQGKTDSGVGDVAMVADNAQGGEQDQSGGPASRPQRATGIKARDHILARHLQQSWGDALIAGPTASNTISYAPSGSTSVSQRQRKRKKMPDEMSDGMVAAAAAAEQAKGKRRPKTAHDMASHGSYARGQSAVVGGRADSADKNMEDVARNDVQKGKKVADMMNGISARARYDRTIKILSLPMVASPGKSLLEQERPEIITFRLCPADDTIHARADVFPPGFIGTLELNKLATSFDASILSIKRFLLSKLFPDSDERIAAETVILSCRGLVLGDKNTIHDAYEVWPRGEGAGETVLRYRGVIPDDKGIGSLTNKGAKISARKYAARGTAGAQPANPAVKAGDRVGVLGSDIVGKVVSISTRGEVSVKPDGVPGAKNVIAQAHDLKIIPDSFVPVAIPRGQRHIWRPHMEDVMRKRAEATLIQSMVLAAQSKNSDLRDGHVAPQAGAHSNIGAQPVVGGGGAHSNIGAQPMVGGGSGGLLHNGVLVSAAGQVVGVGRVDDPSLAQAAAANFPSSGQQTAASAITPALAMQTAASTYPSSDHAAATAAATAATTAAAIFPSLAESSQTAASNNSPSKAAAVASGPNPPEPDGLQVVGNGVQHQAPAVVQVVAQPVTSNMGTPVPVVAQPLPSSLTHLGVPVVAQPLRRGVSHMDVHVVAASPVTATGHLGPPVVAQVLAHVVTEAAESGESARGEHSNHYSIAKAESEAGPNRIKAKTVDDALGSEAFHMSAAQMSDAGRNGSAVETAGRCGPENAAKNGGTDGPARDESSHRDRDRDHDSNAPATAAIEQHKSQKPSTSVKDGTPRALS